MWASAKTFGEPTLRGCSYLVKYVFFVIEVQATTTGRIVSLVITALLTAVYLVITLQELYSYRQSYHTRNSKKPQSLPAASTASIPLTPGNSSSSIPSVHTPSSSVSLGKFAAPRPHHMTLLSHTHSPLKARSTSGKRRPKRRRWSSDLDPMLVGIIICQVMVFTYFIVSTELLLKRNPSNDDSFAQWTFGQILALIVVMPSVFSLAGAISQHGMKPLSKRRRKGTRARESNKKRTSDPESVQGM
ncbi:hypothetical protein C0991_007106 [Blastosporella zonata]|nr:hypothetical protein C0991_007106 [Blastosporella zonata]